MTIRGEARYITDERLRRQLLTLDQDLPVYGPYPDDLLGWRPLSETMADELGWGVLCVSWDPERPAQTVGWLVAELGEGVETPAVLGEWSHYHRNRAITGVVVEEGQARLQVGDFLDNVGFRGSGAEPQDCAICGEPFRASDEGDAEIDYFHLYDGTIVHMACGEGCLPQQLEG